MYSRQDTVYFLLDKLGKIASTTVSKTAGPKSQTCLHLVASRTNHQQVCFYSKILYVLMLWSFDLGDNKIRLAWQLWQKGQKWTLQLMYLLYTYYIVTICFNDELKIFAYLKHFQCSLLKVTFFCIWSTF